MAIPFFRSTEVNQAVKEQPLLTGNTMKQQLKPHSKLGYSSDDEDACELSFEYIVKNKPSPGKVREFLQACVDQMNDDTDEDTDFE